MPEKIGIRSLWCCWERGAVGSGPTLGVGAAVAAAVTRSTAVSVDLAASTSCSAGLGGSASLGPFAGAGASTGLNDAAGPPVGPDARNERLPLVSMISALSSAAVHFAPHNLKGKRRIRGSQAKLCVAQDDQIGSTRSKVFSAPVTRTRVPAGRSGPATSQTVSSTLRRPRPSTIAPSKVNIRPM